MDLRTEKEDLFYALNRANRLAEEASLNYLNMCKKVEVLEKCINEIEKISDDDSFPSDFDVYEERDFYFNQLCKIDEILQKIKEVKGE